MLNPPHHRGTARRLMLVLLAVGASLIWAQGADDRDTEAQRILHLVIDDSMINQVTRDFVLRGLNRAEELNADAIVFEMDTPGGMLGPALEIGEALRAEQRPTLAWVRPEAISAGTLISIACDRIVMAPRALLGDCAAIMAGGGGVQSLGKTERAKIDSYLKAEFRRSAEKNGYPLALCEAMVSLGPALYRIRHEVDDRVKYVREDELKTYGLSKSDLPQPDTGRNGRPDDRTIAPIAHRPVQSAGETWVIDKKVLDADQLLTMTTQEALDYGFSAAVVEDEAQLRRFLDMPDARIITLQRSWSEQLVAILSSPLVRGLLTIVLLMGLYSEMQSPGLGFPGITALLASVVLFGAPYISGLAEVWEILLIVAGFALLAVEMFVIPGFGVAGISGLMLIFFGLVLTYVPAEPGDDFLPQLPQTWAMMREGLLVVVLSLIGSLIGIYFLTKYFGALPVLNRLILQSASGVAPATAADSAPPLDRLTEFNVRIGQTGGVIAGLRPVGRAEIDGQQVDVVTEGGWIEAGATVRVTEIHGNRIVVTEV